MTRSAWDGSTLSGARVRSTWLADVGDDAKRFRTYNGDEFVNEMFATICRDKTIRHEHTEVNGLSTTASRGLGLVQEGGMVACLEPPRLFPGQLPDLDRFGWKQLSIRTTPLTPRRPRPTLDTSRRTRHILGDCHRSTPSCSCSPDSAAFNAP